MTYKWQRSRSLQRLTWLVAGLALLSAGPTHAQNSPDPLKSGFENPPNSARPRVWWHWMNGNITKEGIKLDLEWMHRVGLGGFQTFDAALMTPQVVNQRLVFMTPEWKDAFRFAIKLADQLGLEAAIAGSPGWSETGGPWVPPAQAMKKLVWSETRVQGGTPFHGDLPKPPAIGGPFQNIPRAANFFAPNAPPVPDFYADSAVIAYRAPAGDVPVMTLNPKITTSGGQIDTQMLTDGDLVKTTSLPIAPVDEQSWIQYEFSQPQTLHAVTLAMSGGGGGFFDRAEPVPAPQLETSDDGVQFRVAAELNALRHGFAPSGDVPERTIAFPPVTARFFRVAWTTPKPTARPAMPDGMEMLGMSNTAKPATDYKIAELVLHPGARINRFEEKAGFAVSPDLYASATPAGSAGSAISKEDVVDITSKMQADGTLDWTPPAGEWVVLRFGYSLTGAQNSPASAEATGLEVDKLNRSYVKNYLDHYLDMYKATVDTGLMGKRGLQYVITDSWEAANQNWTDDMIAQFVKRRGYDPRPWLPVLTGREVESAEASDRFLWDFRKTIADLIADEHYGQVEASLQERGLGHYGESHEDHRAFVADGMEVKKLDEVPMGAMWTQAPGVNKEPFDYNADDRESASVAHIYGQNLAAAESMTASAAPWAWSPATLKSTADQEFINGINRIVIHESAHQPLIGKAPGVTLGPFGQWFNRNETWAEQAGAWVNYLARSSYLLQQGHFSADLIYFYGEDSNITALFCDKAPDVPAGYGFDFINADGLIHELSASQGRITTPGGMTYRVLGLDPYSRHMSLPVLRAIHKLVADGAVVAGAKPIDDPSLADDQAEFRKLNDELFGDGTGVHTVGKGEVYAGQSLDDVFNALHVAPDFDYSKPESDARLLFVHRKLADGDLYFVDNRNNRNETVDATFRVTGKAPELWYAETGKSDPVSYKIADGHTTVPLKLEPWGTVFVVFRKPTKTTSLTLPKEVETQLATVDGSWSVTFQSDRGAPASVTLDKLASWSDSADAGVKYFSGMGTYTKAMQATADWFKTGARLWIDLGDVKNLAEVTVNGKSLGIVWHAPYRVDATAALKAGANEVSIKVTNAWVNRLIGDQQPDAAKYTFTVLKPYRADSPLQPSGLLGPVVVLRSAKE
jgi:alpha-L-rhamnosidase